MVVREGVESENGQEYRCELVCSRFRVLSGESAHERTFAHGRKADEAHAGNTSSCNIEADTGAAASAAARLKQFPLEFCKLCLQLPWFI